MNFNKYPDWILSLVSGLLIGVAYLPIPLGFFTLFGLVPLIHIWMNREIKTSLSMSYLASFTAQFIALSWVAFNKGTSPAIAFISLIGVVLYISIFWAILGATVTFLQRRLSLGMVIFPFIWVAMEYTRSFGAMGFPWIDLALTHVYILPAIQFADITGTAGIAFIICMINGLLYLALTEENPKLNFIGVVLIIGIVLGVGSWRMNAVENQLEKNSLRVAVIQPNVDPVQKWEQSFRQELVMLMDSLTAKAIKLEPDFILWPESALPAYLGQSSKYRKPIHQKVIEAGIPLLAGTVDMESDEHGRHYYNGSILLLPDGRYEMYHKVKLVPFAEYIPFSWIFPQLKKLNLGQGNFEQGKEYTVFDMGSHRFSNMICYESSFQRVARKFVERGAEFLTVETNDAWSGNSPGAYQHFKLAQLRAVENRVSIVRSANTGISGIIEPTGKVTEKMAFYEQGIILGQISFMSKNWQTISGDVFSIMCIFIGLVFVFIEWFKQWKMEQ